MPALTGFIGIGLENRIWTAEISQLAFGAARMMQEQEVLERLIAGPGLQHAFCTPNGKSSVCSFSSRTTFMAGRLDHASTEGGV
jgi:hypothetical protein